MADAFAALVLVTARQLLLRECTLSAMASRLGRGPLAYGFVVLHGGNEVRLVPQGGGGQWVVHAMLAVG
ncbi:MAG: hypothetical protein M9929_05735 [Burkholderiaceae bacterium]|nr:hypothetical protein [Burkholderiaceae bacterium]